MTHSVRRFWYTSAAVAVVAIVASVAWRSHSGSNARTPHAAGPASTPAATSGTGSMPGMNMAEGGVVQLTANDLRQFGVTFGTAGERTLRSDVRTVGTVAPDESKLTQVTPRFDGYVERLFVDETGQSVRRGEPLMSVYSPAVVAAEQELLTAAGLEQSLGQSSVPGVPGSATDLVAAARRRLELWDVSDAQIDRIVRAGAVERTVDLYAPASGVVLGKHVVQGQAFHAGETLYDIADLSDVWIDVALREQDAGAVRVGSAATVELTAYPGQPITGRVSFIYPTLDSAARAVRARIQVPNPHGRIKPGMYAAVSIATPTRRALAVPTSAVVNTGNRTLVFLDMGGGRLMPQAVVTGQAAADYTEVLSGVTAGQRVVTSAQYLIDSESNLAEVMKSMIGQMNMSDMNSAGAMGGMPMPPADTGGMRSKGADMKGMKGMKMPPSGR